MSAFMDSSEQLHDASQPFQVFDLYNHGNQDVYLFTAHIEYPHQKMRIRADGTIQMNKDPTYVLGFDGGSKVRMVKAGSKNQFIF